MWFKSDLKIFDSMCFLVGWSDCRKKIRFVLDRLFVVVESNQTANVNNSLGKISLACKILVRSFDISVKVMLLIPDCKIMF